MVRIFGVARLFGVAGLLAIACALTSCVYDAHFDDCAVSCDDTSGCPDGLACGTEGRCRAPSATETCAAILGDAGTGTDAPIDPPSCAGLPATCGPSGTDDCCSIATPIPGGTYYRSYDVATDDMLPDMSYPATVSAFVLDKYEVTVGRFRAFVAAGGGTQASPPTDGSGAHARIPGSGWDASWNTLLVSNAAALATALQCDAQYQTWTTAPGANEALPINCVTWYEAMAFCIWDGGYPPTEAEWNYAAAGGDDQRAYPWSNPPSSLTVGCAYANYDDGGTYCTNPPNGAVDSVGSASPSGDAKWGHTDLAGNVWEWNLDWYAQQYPTTTCDDCANLNPGGICPGLCPTRSVRGGSFSRSSTALRTGNRGFSEPAARSSEFGIRCARSAP